MRRERERESESERERETCQVYQYARAVTPGLLAFLVQRYDIAYADVCCVMRITRYSVTSAVTPLPPFCSLSLCLSLSLSLSCTTRQLLRKICPPRPVMNFLNLFEVQVISHVKSFCLLTLVGRRLDSAFLHTGRTAEAPQSVGISQLNANV